MHNENTEKRKYLKTLMTENLPKLVSNTNPTFLLLFKSLTCQLLKKLTIDHLEEVGTWL